MFLWPVLGCVAVFVFLYFVYWEKHGSTWIARSKAPFSVVVSMSAVLLSGLLVAAIVFGLRRSASVKSNVLVAAIIATITASAAAYWLAALRFSTSNPIWHISIAHGLATAIGIASAILVPTAIRKIGEGSR